MELIEPVAWKRCEVVNRAEQTSLKSILNNGRANVERRANSPCGGRQHQRYRQRARLCLRPRGQPRRSLPALRRKGRFSISVHKGVFLCRQCHPKGGGGAVSLVMFLDDVGFREAVQTLTGARQTTVSKLKAAPTTNNSADNDRRQHEKARWLWSQRQPISGSIAEVYLREVRKITRPLPPTLDFLPPRKLQHHPAMIAAFALPDECEPGRARRAT